MSGNTEMFSGRVEEYARWRSGYPTAKVLGFLREVCGMEAGWRVADIGAGTGMLTEVLLEGGAEVVAVEPNREMRAECERLRTRWPGLQVVDGTAEATGLEAGSLDMVAVGRALHWFEPEGAAREFRRALRAGGWIVSLTQGPLLGNDQQSREFERMQRAHETRTGYVASRTERKDRAAAFLRGLAGEGVTRAEFRTERQLGWEGLLGFWGSLSCTPRAGEVEYPEARRALETFFARWGVDGVIALPEVSYVVAGRVA